MMRRTQIIHEILVDLERLKKEGPHEPDFQYAVQENIRFFQAAKQPLSFLKWQLFDARRIDTSRLLELADLSLPHWETELYDGLRWIERKKFPGLLAPLCKTLARTPGRVFMDAGCGAMETERQVIELLAWRQDSPPRVFIGVDQSPSSYAMIQETFRDVADQVEVTKLKNPNRELLLAVLRPNNRHRVIFIEADALTLEGWLLPQEIDIVYSSRFKHHLTSLQKKQMDKSLKKVGKVALEYDDYRTALSWIPQTLSAWSRPVLLNGALLSRLRQPSKRMLKSEQHEYSIRFFSPPGSYLKTL
jgi:hypothetical protein